MKEKVFGLIRWLIAISSCSCATGGLFRDAAHIQSNMTERDVERVLGGAENRQLHGGSVVQDWILSRRYCAGYVAGRKGC